MSEIEFIDRKTGERKTELVPGKGTLKLLYGTPLGKLILWSLFKRKMLTAVVGRVMNTPFSCRYIKGFAQKNNINLAEAKDVEFKSFNDFFYRKLKHGTRSIDDGVVSPADGKILVFPRISDSRKFFVKGAEFNLADFLKDDELAKKYNDGAMAIIRLAPCDYHRFHFPIGGITSENRQIKGAYYSVSPLALRKSLRVFVENKREYSIIKNDTCGDVLYCEVGATMVGSICQTYNPGDKVEKGEEKGYFKFGGSTVVLLFEPNKIRFNQDLVQNSAKGLETTVLVGEQIATEN